MRQQPLETPRNLRRSASAGRGGARFLDLIERLLVEPRRRAHRRRAQLDQMADLSGRTLADIGLQRGDVQAVAWGGVPATQIGRQTQPARAGAICCAAWPKPCACAPCSPEPAQPQALPEAA